MAVAESKGGGWKFDVVAVSRRSVDEVSDDEDDEDLLPVRVVQTDMVKTRLSGKGRCCDVRGLNDDYLKM